MHSLKELKELAGTTELSSGGPDMPEEDNEIYAVRYLALL